MNGKTRETSLALLLLLSLSAPAAGQNYFMYAPHPAGPAERTVPRGGDGVLVREIEVQKGDTLSGISRKFSGHGSYYPQILLFNDIKNPHNIRSGALVRVPVSKGEAPGQRAQAATPLTSQQTTSKPAPQSSNKISPGDQKPAEVIAGKETAQRRHSRKRRTARRSSRGQAASARKQFNRALASYRRENWRTALERFDRFLATYPSSEFAADANLYKADCYLKLSTQ